MKKIMIRFLDDEGDLLETYVTADEPTHEMVHGWIDLLNNRGVDHPEAPIDWKLSLFRKVELVAVETDRPEYVTCVEHPLKTMETWCGQSSMVTFVFRSIDHAAANSLNGGRLLICSQCMERIIECIKESEYICADWERYPRT